MPSLKQIHLDGMAAFRAGRLDEAAALLEEVLGQVQDLSTLTALTQIARMRGRTAEGLVHAQNALALLAGGAVAPMFALIPSQEVLKSLAAMDPAAVPGAYAPIRNLIFDGIAALGTPDKAMRLSHVVISLAETTGDAALLHAFYNRCLPGFVGHQLPMTLSPATTLRRWRGPLELVELEPAREVEIARGAYARRYPSPGFAARVVPGGQMLCGWDFALTADDEVLSDTSYFGDPVVVGGWFPHRFNTGADRCFHLWPTQVTDIAADVVFLSTPVNFAVGHWLCDILPRLRARNAVALTDVKVAIPAGLPRKHRDLLALCGVRAEDIVECELGGRYRFRNLVVALAGATTVDPPPGNVTFLASHLRAPDAKVQPGANIFLVRSEKTRKVLNQGELDAWLETRGFAFMDLAKTPIAEQRARLGTAETVIGIYGSDLLSCLFMPEGSRFISLDYRAEVDPFTGALDSAAAGIHSILLGIRFRVLDCSGSKRSGETSQKKDRDFTVDCGALEQLLETL